MIIKKINTVFRKHSRWLFGIFTILIIIAFMDFLTPGRGGCDGLGGIGGRSAGMAFGERVSLDDLEVLIRENRVLAMFGMSMGGNMGYPEAFREYCFLAAAKKRGLAVSDKEVVEFVKMFPAFQRDGKYSPELYKEFKDAMVVRQGASDEILVESLRNMLLINKLQTSIGGDVVVTDNEVETYYRRVNARNEVKAALFPVETFLKEVKNDAQAMKTFFDGNRAAYEIPGKISAVVAVFPVSDYTKTALAAAKESDLKAFYTKNPQLFTKNDVIQKYEECAAQVKVEFAKSLSRDLAMRSAYEFAGNAYDAVSTAGTKRGDVFRKLADAGKLKVKEIAPTSFDAVVVGDIKSPELLRDLVGAYNTHWVSNPILVEDTVYVGMPTEQVATRPAEFNEVAARIATDYRNATAQQLATEAAVKAEESLAAITDTAERVKAFGALTGCKFQEFGFVLGSEMPPMDYIASAIAALQLNPGEISQVLPGETGPQLALLVKRAPADMKDLAAKQDALRMNLKMMKRQMFQEAFWEELNEQCQPGEILSER